MEFGWGGMRRSFLCCPRDLRDRGFRQVPPRPPPLRGTTLGSLARRGRAVIRDRDIGRTETRMLLPDEEFYKPTFSPWEGVGFGEFRGILERISGQPFAIPDRCYVLYCLAK